MDGLTRKRARVADPRLSTIKRRLQPKSPPPLPGSYSRLIEGRSAAALAGSAAFDATTVPNDTRLIWGDPSRWNPAMLLGSPTSWDRRDAVKTASSTTRDRDYTAVSAPNVELSFPITTPQNDAIVHNGIDDECDDAHSNNPFEKWQASTHNNTLPLTSFLNYPSMSYAAAHTYARPHGQSIDLIVPFSPVSGVADFNPGFTSTGFGVASTSFDSALFNSPGTPTFYQVRPHVAEDSPLEPNFKFPATQCHSAHAPNVDYYHEEYDTRHLSNNTPWYEEIPEPSLNLAITARPSPQSGSFVPGVVGLKSDSDPSTTAFVGPISNSSSNSNSSKVLLGGNRRERSRRPRGQLLPKDREETSRTRKWKACIRCRMQKIRCIPDPDKPKTEYCLCCRKVLVLETKKVIHRIPCLRWNLNEVVLFRVGGLGFTKRWTGVCVENIPSSDWADERVLTIGVCITKLLCDPIPIKVRRFKPNNTDIQHRYWKRRDTEPPVLITMPAYALADVDATSEEYRRYIRDNAEEAIRRFAGDTKVNDYVRRTFSVALHHGAKAAKKEFGKAKGDPAKLFRNYFRLWLASRFTLGSAYIADENENSEWTAQTPGYPRRQFVSRMITAQFDSIGYKHVLVKLKREVLDELWLLMQKRTDTTFFTVYLIVFMMLHEVAVACQDRRRRAAEQGLQTYYDLEDATAKIKHGADIILGHWHYYKGDVDPLSMSEDSMARAFGTESSEEIQLLMETYREYGQMKKKPRSEMDWEEDPLYLVSQMFEQNWRPMQSCWP